jgi:hypothetical protein
MPRTREWVRRPHTSLPSQAPPYERSREAKSKVVETLHDRVRRSFFFEQLEHGADSALDLQVWIELDAALFVNEADRQRKTQLAPLRLVELAAIKTGANDVQLGLGEGPLHAQDKAVVELGRIVAAVLVDHERIGDGAQFEQTMPVLV